MDRILLLETGFRGCVLVDGRSGVVNNQKASRFRMVRQDTELTL